MAAWTLPNEGPLTDAQRAQAMAHFDDYIRRHRITRADVGHQVGKPKATTIRELAEGTYRKESDDHIRVLNNWIEQHARQSAVRRSGRYVTTTRVAKEILMIAKMALDQGMMALAVGPSGIGKSRCATALSETFSGAILLTIMSRRHTAEGLISHIADELKVMGIATMAEKMRGIPRLERVLHRLKDSNRLLIVDEAHKLHPGGLEFLRELHDATRVPILMLATIDLKRRVERDADPDHGQLYSRIPIIHDLVPDDEPIFKPEDIRKLYQVTPIRLADDALRYLLDVANDLGRGSLRKCESLVVMAARLARKRQDMLAAQEITITEDDLHAAETSLKRDKASLVAIEGRKHRAVAASA